MLNGSTRRTRGNMVLWIAVAVLSLIGLGGNIYQHNTGAKVEADWLIICSEVGVFLAAMFFIIDYLRKRKEDNKEE